MERRQAITRKRSTPGPVLPLDWPGITSVATSATAAPFSTLPLRPFSRCTLWPRNAPATLEYGETSCDIHNQIRKSASRTGPIIETQRCLSRGMNTHMIPLILTDSELPTMEPIPGRNVARNPLAFVLLEHDILIRYRFAVFLRAAGRIIPCRNLSPMDMGFLGTGGERIKRHQ